jgi:hypothetical protein
MSKVELKTALDDFHELHEIVASGRGKHARVDRDLLLKLLMDHSALVAALRGQVREPAGT